MGGLVVAIEGPSAAGKSSVVRELALSPGTRTIPEAFERIRPRPSLEFRSPAELIELELTLLEEEARRFREARRWAAEGTRVIVDTGFLGPVSYTAGLVRWGYAPPAVVFSVLRRAHRLAARGRWGLADLTLFLDVPRAERDRRARRDSAGHPAGLYARHARVARYERTVYRQLVAPVVGGRLRFVRAVAATGVLARRLDAIMDGVGGRAPSRSVAERVLRAIERSGGLGNR